MTAVDLDLVIVLAPLIGVVLGAVVFAVAILWAWGVESTLAAPPSEGDPDLPDNPAALFQPPEDAPTA